jgi:hypothetical protein
LQPLYTDSLWVRIKKNIKRRALVSYESSCCAIELDNTLSFLEDVYSHGFDYECAYQATSLVLGTAFDNDFNPRRNDNDMFNGLGWDGAQR